MLTYRYNSIKEAEPGMENTCDRYTASQTTATLGIFQRGERFQTD